jgi:hypothetical protein
MGDKLTEEKLQRIHEIVGPMCGACEMTEARCYQIDCVTRQILDVIEDGLGKPTPLGRVLAETERQTQLWGIQDHPDGVWYLILGEEVGEVGDAVLEAVRGLAERLSVLSKETGDVAKAILGSGDVEEEVVQVAAVALSWLESIERQRR